MSRGGDVREKGGRVLGMMHAASALHYWAGVLSVVAALALWLRAQSLHLALRAQEHQSRWASNLRDLINVGCCLALAAGYWWAGLPFAAALLFAGTLGVVLDGLRHVSLAGWRRSVASGLVLASGLALSVFARPALLASNRLAEWLLPG